MFFDLTVVCGAVLPTMGVVTLLYVSHEGCRHFPNGFSILAGQKFGGETRAEARRFRQWAVCIANGVNR